MDLVISYGFGSFFYYAFRLSRSHNEPSQERPAPARECAARACGIFDSRWLMLFFYALKAGGGAAQLPAHNYLCDTPTRAVQRLQSDNQISRFEQSSRRHRPHRSTAFDSKQQQTLQGKTEGRSHVESHFPPSLRSEFPRWRFLALSVYCGRGQPDTKS